MVSSDMFKRVMTFQHGKEKESWEIRSFIICIPRQIVLLCCGGRFFCKACTVSGRNYTSQKYSDLVTWPLSLGMIIYGACHVVMIRGSGHDAVHL